LKKGRLKMRKVAKVALTLMVISTTIYLIFVVYANANSSYSVDSNGNGKDPIAYGVWKAYFAEKLETAPQEWCELGELGITFGEKVQYAEKETYKILIVDQEKALPWMNGTASEPYAVKYGDIFYRIMSLWTTPGLPEHLKQWQFPIGVALGAGWVCAGVVFFKESEKK
jgi:hypothetical protein